MGHPVQICRRCVMDTSDPNIVFDAAGVCNHCHVFTAHVRRSVVAGEAARRVVAALVARIQDAGRGREYDCIVGVSGGVDSTYVAYQARQLGLRPLAVHLDNGWNSELAVDNVARALKALQIDLLTHVIDWEEFRDLHLAFLRASVINSEIPTDHAIRAILYRVAAAKGVRFILSGSNIATEGILPPSWGYNNRDLRHIKALARRFGGHRLRTFPTLSLPRYIYYTMVRGIEVIPLLNYLEYDKDQAKALIARELGWRDYGGKHHESIYTLFYQAYILPRKFGVDKRRAHLSSLICGGQMSREQALAELSGPALSDKQLAEYREYVTKKLGLNEAEFDQIMNRAPCRHEDYPTSAWLYDRLVAIHRWRRRRRSAVVPALPGAPMASPAE